MFRSVVVIIAAGTVLRLLLQLPSPKHPITVALLSLAPCAVIILGFSLYTQRLRRERPYKRQELLTSLGIPQNEAGSKKIVGFFHPYCNAGGGGERVLWTAIAMLQRTEPDIVSVVYSGDVDATKEEIIANVKSKFDIELSPTTLGFVFLESRWAVEDTTWPRFTLLGQSLGSMYLAWEAMSAFIPDLFIDTMGYAFSFHVVSWLGNIPVGAYVHYPTISTDMLQRVRTRTASHTNSAAVSSSGVLSFGKLLYYRMFMHQYAHALRRARFLMVNSSWTKNHVTSVVQYKDPLLDSLSLLLLPFILVISSPIYLLKIIFPAISTPRLYSISEMISPAPSTLPEIVYPPCDTRQMVEFPLEDREPVILSIAQFRPEKDHAAQLRSFAELLKNHPEYAVGEKKVRLVLIGGSRNTDDAARVDGLKALAQELGVENQTEFLVNAPYPVILEWLSRASIGLSTMMDEHFGINIVEYMAAGVIPVTHASGGPLNDIVVPYNGQPTGYHARTVTEFAQAFQTVLVMSPTEQLAMRKRARQWAVQRFSAEEFERGWNASGWKGTLHS
ncbi:UDP-Glycosyltransferase/glycogen phosphorylase [Punctularia strigosozonata HHB-11173 SS5]|uniref:UDP-Glycosyltransferase/glycogen phosphorylase n=1 Tax=Punctularia strigosozonata (strain HHB-11173) TaxID=741275 RepID=UPI00044168D7|nr:UDP-Glycosyltransferase/glycogen phosphorylase [Punctularia strigosozonata HHB-11173 SS5]EIN12293.1 UDP-Glycosyltransferase/glycogen phosphorylase [Punctularia strigosozonata HHB-11173 SS5]